MNRKISFAFSVALSAACLVFPAMAQVSIPDPGLNAAVREALQKPVGPLTQQDMLGLTHLHASGRGIINAQGLETAYNLLTLNLDSNSLTNFGLPSTLTNLQTLEINFNPLSQCTVPGGMTNLTALDLFGNRLTNFVLSNGFPNLTLLNLGFNSLSKCSLPANLTNVETLFLEGNQLTNFTLPSGLTGLSELDLSGNALSSFALPPDATNLLSVLIFANQLTNITLPVTLRRLASIDLDFNRFRSFSFPAGLTNLSRLTLLGNQLTNLTLPPDIKNLTFLDLADNQLAAFTLPAGLGRLDFLRLSGNRLKTFSLPEGLTNLPVIFIRSNQLTSLTLPAGLISLVQIDVMGNQLTNLTLPPDITKLVTLGLDGNPLTTLVLSDPLSATNLAPLVASLQNRGVAVYTYPLAVQLVQPALFSGAFKIGVTGPPGAYAIMGSTNLTDWTLVGTASNAVGAVIFHDVTANLVPQRFYRAELQTQRDPENMVFVPPNTFTMGTPANELHRQPDEGPQTTVTISRGFWIGKYEVTQREYQEVVGSNPSQFPGDLDRPVETVSWLDATNYCALLTQRELAAGRIPPGSRYRLPTEAEWECAARAGTSTRFSYGDDPSYANLTNHAWYWFNSGFGTHPVGRKLPNPWGLFDMEGNVLEWTLDWYGPYPGGSVTDPQGPASNVQGVKVIRGGAWDAAESDCRSGRRLTKGVHPFITDSILGFRVVLTMEP